MPDNKAKEGSKSPRTFPWRVELELAKFLNTFGFSDYGSFLWDRATAAKSESIAFKKVLSPEIEKQIRAQARHDPSVIAAGERAITSLRQVPRSARDLLGMHSRGLLGGSEGRPDVLFVVPTLTPEEARAIAEISALVQPIGVRSFLILITDQPSEAFKETSPAVPGARVLYWLDHCSGPRAAHSRLLALFIHVIGATLNVVSSRLGLEMIGQYGHALGRFHRFFCMLNVPAEAEAHLFRDVHHLREVAPHAKMLAGNEEQARVLRSHSAGLGGPGVAVLPRPEASSHVISEIFGRELGDRRTDAARTVIANIRSGRQLSLLDSGSLSVRRAAGDQIDITVLIVFHREKDLAAPALASLADMITFAKEAGLRVEARAMLDNTDDITRRLIEVNGAFLDDVQIVSFGDPSLTRNAGAAKARGAYLTFLDGDDLWGSEWLSRAYRAAIGDETSRAAVWHPSILYSFFSSDCDRYSPTETPSPTAWSQHLLHQASSDPDFEPNDLLFENLWSANVFAATEIFLRFPYRPNNYEFQTGIEDWRWNLETFGSGVQHLLVPDTVHLIRQKERSSLGQTHNLRRLLPILD